MGGRQRRMILKTLTNKWPSLEQNKGLLSNGIAGQIHRNIQPVDPKKTDRGHYF